MKEPIPVVEISAPGGPEVLVMGERPRPVPGPGQVLIEVKAAGINGADLAQRKGVYPPPPGASDILGMEVAGVVAEVNGDANGLQVGDRVCALLTGGGYAGFCLAEAGEVLPLPANVSFVEGAALMETLCTVWTNVFQDARLKQGESFLVHGGASGIGMTAIQLARAFGAAKVFATVGADDKAAAIEALGARAINHKTQDFAEVIKAEAKEGVDVILDVVGGSYLERNVRSLKYGGRMATIALNGGRMGQLDIARLMMKRLQLTGSTLRSRTLAEKVALVAEVREHCWPLVESGGFKPLIDSTFPLAEAAAAHARMEAGLHIGKVVLTV
jgi:putative PIG3 family NAD(P)H quinone oxidoreductase